MCGYTASGAMKWVYRTASQGGDPAGDDGDDESDGDRGTTWKLDNTPGTGGKSCDEVCPAMVKGSTCDEKMLDGLTDDDAFKAAYASAGHTCKQWNADCSIGNKCPDWGIPQVHNSHLKDGTCWKGNGHASCSQKPVDGQHRRLCPCAGTPSSRTGPSGGHNGNGFVFAEASGGKTGDKALLTSPAFTISSPASCRLSFAYHMFGTGMDKLSVRVGTSQVFTMQGQQQTTQGASWRVADVSLSGLAATSTATLVFEGERSSGWDSDMAITGVKLTGCTASSGTATSATTAKATSIGFVRTRM
eukprot:g1348.t1